jgi:sporulation protein YlmC with PRC-barrel domain
MIRSILAITAIAVMTYGAHAQTDPGVAAASGTVSPAGDLTFLPMAAGPTHLASTLIGETVYNSAAEGSQEIGEIRDLIIAEDGSVEAVVISVGGFLGVGEKDVAVNFANLQWAPPATADEEPKLVVAATSEQLSSAPAFDIAAFEAIPPADTATDTTAVAPETDAILPAPADQMAGAPANFSDVDPTSISANDLIGTTVFSAENENVGEVADVILSNDGTIDAVVLDIGGFLGIGQKPVAIAFEGLGIRRDENGALYVYTAFNRAQLEAAPDYDAERYPGERDVMRLQAG